MDLIGEKVLNHSISVPSYCAVVGCNNNTNRNSTKQNEHPIKHFFKIPSGRDKRGRFRVHLVKRRQAWLDALRRTDSSKGKMNHLTVCSDHFVSGKPVDTHFCIDYIPTQNLGDGDENLSSRRRKPKVSGIQSKKRGNLKSATGKSRRKKVIEDKPLDLDELYYHNELISMGLEVNPKIAKKKKVDLEYVKKYEPYTGETTDSASESEEMNYWYDRHIFEKSVIKLMQEHNYCEKLAIEKVMFRRKILALDHIDLDYLSDHSSLESDFFEQEDPNEDPLNVPCDVKPLIIKTEDDYGESPDFEDYEVEGVETKIETHPIELKFEVKMEDGT